MTDTKKQTAVEWLKEVYIAQGSIFIMQFEGAMRMEREQIEDAYCNGVIDGAGKILNRDSIKPDAVQDIEKAKWYERKAKEI